MSAGGQPQELSPAEQLEQLEKIFSLLPDEERKRNLALALFIGYSEFATFNAIKAEFYLAKALLLPTPEDSIDFIATFFSWFTTLRLGTFRGAREYSLYSNLATPKMGDYFNVLQLSYGPEALLYLFRLLKESFDPKNETNQDQWLYQRFSGERFKRVLLSREFLSALTNALGWLLVNGICYLSGATPVVCCILNLIGFVADVFHDAWFAKKELEEWEKLKDHALVKEYGLLKPLEGKISGVNEKLRRVTLVAVLILVGMAFFYCPVFLPALPALLFQMFGATTVLGGGVIYGGLFGRLARLDITKQKERLMNLSNQERAALAITILLAAFAVLGAFSFIPVPVFFILASALPIAYLGAKKIMNWCGPQPEVSSLQPETSSLSLLDSQELEKNQKRRDDAVTIIKTQLSDKAVSDRVTSTVTSLDLNRPKNPALDCFYAALRKEEQASKSDCKTLPDKPSEKPKSVFHLVPTLFQFLPKQSRPSPTSTRSSSPPPEYDPQSPSSIAPPLLAPYSASAPGSPPGYRSVPRQAQSSPNLTSFAPPFSPPSPLKNLSFI